VNKNQKEEKIVNRKLDVNKDSKVNKVESLKSNIFNDKNTEDLNAKTVIKRKEEEKRSILSHQQHQGETLRSLI